MTKSKLATRIIEDEDDMLYERYIAPVAAFAETANSSETHTLLPRFAELCQSRIPQSHTELIAEIMARYIHWIHDVEVAKLQLVLDALWRRAKKEAASHNSSQTQDYLTSSCVDAILADENESAPLRSIGYMLYQIVAIMQLSLVFEQSRQMTEAQLTRRIIDMHVCLERSDLCVVDFIHKRQPTHKQLASLGGKKRDEKRYGSAREYTIKRAKNPSEAESQMSMKRFARKILSEIERQGMAEYFTETNRERTVYDWVREHIRLPAEV